MLDPTQQQLNIIAKALARHMAYCPADIDDLVQEALLSAHQAFQRFRPHKPFAFARTVMQRSILTYYRKHYWHTTHETLATAYPSHIRLDETTTPLNDVEHKITMQQYFDALECGCGGTARLVAENMVAPRDAVICEYIFKEVAYKQQLIRKNHKQPQHKGKRHHTPGVARIRLSQRQLREALGFTRVKWARTVQEIRRFTRGWLALQNKDEKKIGT